MCARPKKQYKPESYSHKKIHILRLQHSDPKVGYVYQVRIDKTKFMLASKQKLYPGSNVEFTGKFKRIGKFKGYVASEIRPCYGKLISMLRGFWGASDKNIEYPKSEMKARRLASV